MNINQAGLDLIKSCEGCKLEAYPDPGSAGEPYTIGFGHTGQDVHRGLTIDEDQALVLLQQDLEKFEQGVSSLVTVDINENQFSAIVCLTYNIGLENLKKSLLLHCINTLHRDDAANEFLKWNKAAGKVLPGLTVRRQKERQLFIAAA